MRVLLVALLLLAPTALPGLAHASPPDPTWIQGIYDDRDGDDVVALIASGAGEAPPAAAIAPPLAVLITRLTGPVARMPLALWASATRPRAPPAR